MPSGRLYYVAFCFHVHFNRLAGWVRIGVFSAGWRYPTGLIPGVRDSAEQGKKDGHRYHDD